MRLGPGPMMPRRPAVPNCSRPANASPSSAAAPPPAPPRLRPGGGVPGAPRRAPPPAALDPPPAEIEEALRPVEIDPAAVPPPLLGVPEEGGDEVHPGLDGYHEARLEADA